MYNFPDLSPLVFGAGACIASFIVLAALGVASIFITVPAWVAALAVGVTFVAVYFTLWLREHKS